MRIQGGWDPLRQQIGQQDRLRVGGLVQCSGAQAQLRHQGLFLLLLLELQLLVLLLLLVLLQLCVLLVLLLLLLRLLRLLRLGDLRQ